MRLASLPYGLCVPPTAFTPEPVSASTEIHKDYLRKICGQKCDRIVTEYLPIQNNRQKWYARRDLNPQPSVPELGIYTCYYSDSVEKWGDYAPAIHVSEAIMRTIDTLSGAEMGQN